VAITERTENQLEKLVTAVYAVRMADNESTTGLSETIEIPDRDLSANEIGAICRKMTRLLAFALGNCLRHSGQAGSPGSAHPVFQQVYTASVNLEAAAATIEAAGKQVLIPGNQIPTLVGRA